MFRPAVIVMAKAPRAGEAKTRLAPLLSAEGAAGLAACLFADVLAGQTGAAELFVAYAPSDGRAALEELARGRAARWLEQRGRDLGERLSTAVGRIFAEGFGPVVVLGADSPTLPREFAAEALEALSRGRADVALGPTEDGGYYLVGLRRPAPGLFRGVAWSTERAFAQTSANAARLGLRLRELPRWYDVDTPADLRRLREELLADEHARARAPSTYAWLAQRETPPALPTHHEGPEV